MVQGVAAARSLTWSNPRTPFAGEGHHVRGYPHPALSTSIRADLRRLDIKYRDFQDSSNPPILHRKETFVAPDYPGRDKFARLTMQEEKHGLLSETLAIGTRRLWSALVEGQGFRFRGHRLVRRRSEQ